MEPTNIATSRMDSTLTVLSPLRKLTWSKVLEKTKKFDYKRPFVEMIGEHPIYGHMMKVKGVYEVKLVHLESAHWYLLVRTKDSTMPYVSLEVRTTDLKDLVQFTREIDSQEAGISSDMGIYEGTLLSLCELADRVVKEMDSYHPLTSNCQTFCNKLLKMTGKYEVPTSTSILDRVIDLLGEAISGSPPTKVKNSLPIVSRKTKLDNANQKQSNCVAMSSGGAKESHTATKKRDPELPENIPSLSISDLTWLNKTLLPIACSWKSIGSNLHIDARILTRIENEYRGHGAKQCLCEILREYLQQRINPPTWIVLVSAVAEESYHVAKSIVEGAKSIRKQK